MELSFEIKIKNSLFTFLKDWVFLDRWKVDFFKGLEKIDIIKSY